MHNPLLFMNGTHPTLFAFGRLSVLVFAMTIAVVACGRNDGAGQPPGTVHSYLSGEITLNPEIDSIPDFSGFQVLVGAYVDGQLDTLAFAETDVDGRFGMDVYTPRPNIYSLILARSGAVLRADEIAIADGDSASFKVQFPFGNRPLMIRSRENAALLGYKNTMALHNAEIDRLTRSGESDRSVYADRIGQTSAILWSLRETSPNTLAASFAAAQSVLLLEGWNDSLLVERARQLEPDNVNIGAVAGAARRAQMRRAGWEAAVALLEELQAKATDPAARAALQSELVLAYRDAGQTDRALDAARRLKMEYAVDSTWIRWADRAIYDLEHLMPGMDAPPFQLTDTEGRPVNLDRFKGTYTVLEFYLPGPDFERQLNARNAFYRADKDASRFEILSVSLQPDTLLNQAFFEGRDLPGVHVFLPEGPLAPIVRDYNVYLLPTRFLIDPEGKIAGKYVLENGTNAYQDALTLALGRDG